MTTIAYDGTMVAADTMAIQDGYRSSRPFHKIRLDQLSGILFAFTGVSAMFEPMIKWCLEAKADPGERPHLSTGAYNLLVFPPDGLPLFYNNDCAYPTISGAPDAWGCGCDFAIGAMLWGANAAQAVGVAIIANHSGTGGTIDSFVLERGRWHESG